MSISTDKKTNYLSTETCLSSKEAYRADYLGLIPYEPALKLQQLLMQARTEGNIPDTVLLLQHPPVFTVGRFRGEEDIIAAPQVLAQEGIAIFHTNRGGGVTYHGPGQLVGYPILNLKENRLGVREYIWKLEEVVINLLLTFGIHGYRLAKHPGSVWADREKICSIGIYVSRYITMHGFTLNVNTNLRHFEYINPCGIKGAVMTSISELIGYPVEVKPITENFLHSFSAIFGLEREQGDVKCLAMPNALSG
mgnify:CR=1 FL=1